MPYSVAGALGWATTFTLVGYGFSEPFEDAGRDASRVALLGALGAAILLVVGLRLARGAAEPPENRSAASRIVLEAAGRENATAMAMTVLVVDDHPGFRACARRVLEAEGYRVVGDAADGASALARARELRPQLALVDVYLPDCDGFELAGRLAELDDPPTILLTSSHERSELEPLVPPSAARGFIPKDELSSESIEELL